MATKKAKKKGAASHSSARKHNDQGTFLLVLGGGFLIIVFILFFLSVGGRNNPSGGHEAVVTDMNAAGQTLVVIQNNTFTTPVTVKSGTKVTWINKDPSVQSVVADDESFDLGDISEGQAASYTFENPGTYSYHSSQNPEMRGSIVVE